MKCATLWLRNGGQATRRTMDSNGNVAAPRLVTLTSSTPNFPKT